MTTREKVNSLALRISDTIVEECATEGMDLPDSFEDKFHEELEELLAKFYGDPDYGNYN
jgi:hypothetical protein